MLVGSGANGKSTFIKLLKKFLGEKNCVAISLQQLTEDRFIKADLFGKLANLYADLSSNALKETGVFKILTGEDLVTADRKFKNPFTFYNYAKLIFSCNYAPRSPDDSDAYYRRWIVINFPNQFLPQLGNEKTNILDELITDEELSGLLNKAIIALKNLLTRGKFTGQKTIQEIREEYIRISDSVGAFVIDMIEIDSNEFIEKKKLYSIYCEYCIKNKYPAVAENTFHKRLQKHIKVEDYRINILGKRSMCWKGIKINNKININENDNQKMVREVNEVRDFSSFKIVTQDNILKYKKNVDYIDYVDQKQQENIYSPNNNLIENNPDYLDIKEINIFDYFERTDPTFLPCSICGLTNEHIGWTWKDKKGRPVCDLCIEEEIKNLKEKTIEVK